MMTKGLISKYPFFGSPNQSSRMGADVTGVVIHYTAGGSASGSVQWLCNPVSKVSAHFVISRHGDVIQLVPVDRKAWHAGMSEMQVGDETIGNANRFTIGVELANHGYLHRIDGEWHYELGRALKPYRRAEPVFGSLHYDTGLVVKGYWEPYPDRQIDALAGLLLDIKAVGYQQAAANIVGHEEIAMPFGRKSDPGPMFPWGRFYRKLKRRTASGIERLAAPVVRP